VITCPLTTGLDTVKGTAGNDTFLGSSSSVTGESNSNLGDTIDGGDGIDTVKIFSNTTTVVPTLTNVENLWIQDTIHESRDISKITGLTSLELTGGVTIAAGLVTVTMAAGQTLTLSEMTDADGADDGANTGALTIAAAATVTTQDVALKVVGGASALLDLDLDVAGTGVSRLNLTSTGANHISLANSGAALSTVTVSGAGATTIWGTTGAAIRNFDSSAATGAVTVDLSNSTAGTNLTFVGGSGNTSVTTNNTAALSVTTGAGKDTVNLSDAANTATINTGAGNDEVIVGAQGRITSVDSINGGEGTDTITISDATINATTKTALAAGTSGFEVVKTSNVAEVAINFQTLSTINTVQVGTASTATAAASATAGTAGIASVDATMESTADVLIISASRTGQVGSIEDGAADNADVGGRGGNGITISPFADSGTNAATVKFVGATTITGGAGAAVFATTANATGDTGGAGGTALNAVNVETLNIDVSGTAAIGGSAGTVTLTGGAGGLKTGAAATGGATGAAGDTLVVGTNATIVITSSLTGDTAVVHNDINLGTVVGNNVTINASTFEGKLTATAATGNVTITGGNAADSLTGGAGADSITGGAGNDTLSGAAGADTISGGIGNDTITGGDGTDTMTGGVGADQFAFAVGDGGGADGAAVADIITDFTVGVDKLQFTAVTDIVSAQQTAVQTAVTGLAAGSTNAQIATAMSNASSTDAGVSFAVFGGNTYVLFETTGANTTFVEATMAFIQLTSVTTAPTFAADVIA
jgi:hypothetical protein